MCVPDPTAGIRKPLRLALAFGALALLALLPELGRAESFTGVVVRVTDGDTIVVRRAEGSEEVKIRLAEIDTPERSQPYGTEARQALLDRLFGETVRVDVASRDRYARLVADVYRGDLHVNAELVRLGYAWVYRQYASNETLFALERDAQAAGLGLWGLPAEDRVAPWAWRRGRRAPEPPASTRSTPPAATPLPPECSEKRTCREMTSCEEARHYLKVCGLRRLDGDGDGVPCEALCR